MMLEKGWLPYKLIGKNGDGKLEWLYIGNKRFTEPFFDDTIRACKTLKENQVTPKPISDFSEAIEMSNAVIAVAPASVIFHVSRCGSTLLTQLLCCDEQNIVLSEVPLFDAILRLWHSHNEADQTSIENYMSACIKLHSVKNHEQTNNLFIKTDSWHLHFYSIYRKLFPAIPFVLLYRHPLQVLQSQQKQRGMQSVPGLIEPSVFGLTSDEAASTDLDVYMSKVLTGYFQKMLVILQDDPLAIPCNYSAGIQAITEALYTTCGLTLHADTKRQFADRSMFHAKHPHQLFIEEIKQETTPEYLADACMLYNTIEHLRLSKQHP